MLLCVEMIVGVLFGDLLLQKVRSVAMLYKVAFLFKLGPEALRMKQPTPRILLTDQANPYVLSLQS